ncbi:hypothetical protein GCM10011491_23610 [Brucella endophytica]|uniref:Uncharacterized protein n=1 Tax=Brucella endophytica TaxID=1963359 RepID=A0A916SDD1_9HYPH|nr:hypothetical protein GCM10011491_23610 [Brucella endophytica]
MIAEQHGERVRKPQVETRRPHPGIQPEDTGERLRRDAIGERKAMDPARQEFIW